MWVYVLIGFVVLLGAFLIFISTREGKFYYEIKENFKAPVSKIFPYISDLKKGGEWSPFEKVDPKIKKEIIGAPDQVGSKLIFSGNREAGAGSLELVHIVPNEVVEIRLIMTAPFKADNLIRYRLTKVDEKTTQFTWSMEGDGGFIGKFMNFFVDCEKLVMDQCRKGMTNLRPLVEDPLSSQQL